MKASIDYFKLQAKNFFRDFKTQKQEPNGIFSYTPRFFNDIDDIIVSCDVDEKHFTLMQAQHLISYLSGFNKWADLLHASETELEIGRIILEHRNNPITGGSLFEDWKMYLSNIEQTTGALGSEQKLDLLQIYLEIEK